MEWKREKRSINNPRLHFLITINLGAVAVLVTSFHYFDLNLILPFDCHLNGLFLCDLFVIIVSRILLNSSYFFFRTISALPFCFFLTIFFFFLVSAFSSFTLLPLLLHPSSPSPSHFPPPLLLPILSSLLFNSDL